MERSRELLALPKINSGKVLLCTLSTCLGQNCLSSKSFSIVQQQAVRVRLCRLASASTETSILRARAFPHHLFVYAVLHHAVRSIDQHTAHFARHNARIRFRRLWFRRKIATSAYQAITSVDFRHSDGPRSEDTRLYPGPSFLRL